MTTTHAHPTTAAAVEQRPGLLVTGLTATVAAMVATTVVAALAMAAGVDFEMPDGGEAVPLSGCATLAGVFSVIGIAIAAALRRWSARPAQVFVRVAITLTAISLVPPFLVEANAATVAALLLIHLVAAAIVIPVLARRLRS